MSSNFSTLYSASQSPYRQNKMYIIEPYSGTTLKKSISPAEPILLEPTVRFLFASEVIWTPLCSLKRRIQSDGSVAHSSSVTCEDRVQYRGEFSCGVVWDRQRRRALMTLTLITKTQPRSQLLLLTQIPLHALTLCRAYFFFPPNDIFSVFFFCASLNKRHTFMLASG